MSCTIFFKIPADETNETSPFFWAATAEQGQTQSISHVLVLVWHFVPMTLLAHRHVSVLSVSTSPPPSLQVLFSQGSGSSETSSGILLGLGLKRDSLGGLLTAWHGKTTVLGGNNHGDHKSAKDRIVGPLLNGHGNVLYMEGVFLQLYMRYFNPVNLTNHPSCTRVELWTCIHVSNSFSGAHDCRWFQRLLWSPMDPSSCLRIWDSITIFDVFCGSKNARGWLPVVRSLSIFEEIPACRKIPVRWYVIQCTNVPYTAINWCKISYMYGFWWLVGFMAVGDGISEKNIPSWSLRVIFSSIERSSVLH